MHPIFEEELKELNEFIEKHELPTPGIIRWLMRLRNFLGAANYDMKRTKPASDEAHGVWFHIMDKPHWALPNIQNLIDERNEARKVLKMFVENYPRANVDASDSEIKKALGKIL